jgi:hypothetical protein
MCEFCLHDDFLCGGLLALVSVTRLFLFDSAVQTVEIPQPNQNLGKPMETTQNYHCRDPI